MPQKRKNKNFANSWMKKFGLKNSNLWNKVEWNGTKLTNAGFAKMCVEFFLARIFSGKIGEKL